MFENLSCHGIIAAALIAPPGPDVITALARVNPGALNDYLRVDYLIALDRQTGRELDALAFWRVAFTSSP